MNSNHAKKLFILLTLMEEMGFQNIDVSFNDTVGLATGHFLMNLKFTYSAQAPKKENAQK